MLDGVRLTAVADEVNALRAAERVTPADLAEAKNEIFASVLRRRESAP